jgi:predicted amidohydrolase
VATTPNRTVRVGLIQMRCEKAALEQNLTAFAGYLAEAAARRIDIVAFPEMCLTGYADPTRQPEAVLTLDGPEVTRLLAVTQGFPGTVLAGLIEANPDGGKPFITQIAARGGALIGVYRKVTIEGDELPWFSPGPGEVPVVDHDGVPFGMAICADIGNREVFARCADQGAALVFELAAPGLYGAQAMRDWAAGYAWWEGECQRYLSEYARALGVWIVVATQAGRTSDEDFPGGGYAFAPTGERVFATPDGSPGAAYLEIDRETGGVTEIP